MERFVQIKPHSPFKMKGLHEENEIFLFVATWMELENIVLSEVNQVQKDKGHMLFSLICGI
jgi:hypothetical protein